MINTKCVICRKNNFKILYPSNFKIKDLNKETFSARRIPDKIHYQIVRCNDCGLIYSNPILSKAKIEKLYKSSKFTYGDFENDLNITYGYYLKRILNELPSKEKLLEIGCGNGFFLKYAKGIGFKEVWGVEPGKDIVKKAEKGIKEKIIIDIFKKDQFPKNSFDIVCLFQVLDHIPDPNEALEEIYKILKPGGVVFCFNHNVNSFSAKLLGEKSPIFDIEHTYLFDKNTIRKIFLMNAFKILDVFTASNIYPFSYILRMLPIPKTIKNLLASVLNKFNLEDKRIWLNLGNLGIYAKK